MYETIWYTPVGDLLAVEPQPQPTVQGYSVITSLLVTIMLIAVAGVTIGMTVMYPGTVA
jgi:hypothetical protein